MQTEVTLLEVGTTLLERRRIVLAWAVVGIILAPLLVIALQGTSYTVEASVISTAPGGGSDAGLRGLANQLGFGGLEAAGATGVTASSAVLVKLVESPVILGRIVDDSLKLSSSTGSVTALLDFFTEPASERARNETERELRRREGIRQLRSMVSSERDRESGMVRISVTSQWPDVSFHLSNRILAELNKVNLEIGQAQASDERRFVEERITDQRVRLEQAERQLGDFLRANRQYRDSPELIFEQERLNREVALQQEVLVGLAQAVEDARVREVRDTPVLTVVEPPMIPVERDRWELSKWALLGLIFGLAAGLTHGLVAAMFARRLSEQDPDVGRFVAALKESVSLITRSRSRR